MPTLSMERVRWVVRRERRGLGRGCDYIGELQVGGDVPYTCGHLHAERVMAGTCAVRAWQHLRNVVEPGASLTVVKPSRRFAVQPKEA